MCLFDEILGMCEHKIRRLIMSMMDGIYRVKKYRCNVCYVEFDIKVK